MMEPNRSFGFLLTWATWVRLRHPALTRINLVASPLLGIAFAVSLALVPGGINFTQEFGVAHQVNGLLQILAPFFIGALTVISSLDRVELDMAMGGQQPTLIEYGEAVCPTRREFFGYLFGYLAALSVLIYAAGAAGMAVGSSSAPIVTIVSELRGSWWIHVIRGLYGIALGNLALTTFVGLHFLVVYLPARRFTPGARPRSKSPEPSSDFVPDRQTNPESHVKS